MSETPAERTQREVQEIAEVLSRQTGQSVMDVWNEALRLHRVRYETPCRDELWCIVGDMARPTRTHEVPFLVIAGIAVQMHGSQPDRT